MKTNLAEVKARIEADQANDDLADYARQIIPDMVIEIKRLRALLKEAKHELKHGTVVASTADGWVSLEKRIDKALTGWRI